MNSHDNLAFEAARSALLVMDFQVPMVERIAPDGGALLGAAAAAIAAARRAGMRVIHVVVGFRPGFPEISPHNRSFSALKSGSGLSTAIHPAVAPADGEVVVTKHRVGAFHGTDLDMILRAHEVDSLVLCGIATSGVVLSTLRHAADADYRLWVLRDACADMDAEVHACLLDKVFPRQASVITVDECVCALAG